MNNADGNVNRIGNRPVGECKSINQRNDNFIGFAFRREYRNPIQYLKSTFRCVGISAGRF